MMLEKPTEEDFKNIRNKIFDYLSRQGFSEKKLLQKVTNLKKWYPQTKRYTFYTSKYVSKVINELKREGVIDEKQYAQDVLRQLKDKKDGALRIKQKMYRRLIDPIIIEEIIREFDESGRDQDYDKIIRLTIQKKESLDRKKISDREQFPKLYAFLAQKGYLPDDVRIILNKVGISYN